LRDAGRKESLFEATPPETSPARRVRWTGVIVASGRLRAGIASKVDERLSEVRSCRNRFLGSLDNVRNSGFFAAASPIRRYARRRYALGPGRLEQ
jgi:hypothetical protein